MDSIDTLTVNAGNLQPAERDRLFAAVVKAQRTLLQGTLSAGVVVGSARNVGIDLSRMRRTELVGEARKIWGDCVREPSAPEQMIDLTTRNWGNGGPLVRPK